MIYTADYDSPIGKILLASREGYLIGLWINSQSNYLVKLADEITENPNDTALMEAKTWLDQYFQGKKPDAQELKLRPIGSDFRQDVWKILRTIPYGQTITYGEIAHRIAEQRSLAKMSAQAVGGAVGSNPISIIIPCHRVIGTDGSLTGYAGGLDTKIKLLQLEQTDFSKLKDQRSR